MLHTRGRKEVVSVMDNHIMNMEQCYSTGRIQHMIFYKEDKNKKKKG